MRSTLAALAFLTLIATHSASLANEPPRPDPWPVYSLSDYKDRYPKPPEPPPKPRPLREARGCGGAMPDPRTLWDVLDAAIPRAEGEWINAAGDFYTASPLICGVGDRIEITQYLGAIPLHGDVRETLARLRFRDDWPAWAELCGVYFDRAGQHLGWCKYSFISKENDADTMEWISVVYSGNEVAPAVWARAHPAPGRVHVWMMLQIGDADPPPLDWLSKYLAYAPRFRESIAAGDPPWTQSATWTLPSSLGLHWPS